MRYRYTKGFFGENYFRPRLFTDAIKLLVSINFGIFVLQTLSSQEANAFRFFGIVPKDTWSQLMIWQPFTYLFFHGGIWHVLINMLVLWMFGSELEMMWGRKSFFKYYFLTGVGSGIVTIIFNMNSQIPVVGASGAIYGILLAYGLMFPNRLVYLYFLFPVRVKYFVIFIGVVAFYSSINPGYSGVSHLTHLSGMVIGFFYLRSNISLGLVKRFLTSQVDEVKRKVKKHRQEKIDEIRREVDRILDKINEVGYDGLNDEEQTYLFEASKKLSGNEDRN